jgi:dsDNA-specific endonuclease/ATPase MutS2
MVEASGYLFRDIEALLKEAEEALEEFRTGSTEAYRKHKEYLSSALRELDKICSKYKDDAEASVIRSKLEDFLRDLDSSKLTIEMEIQQLDRIIERVHHLVDWRKLAMASGYDLPFSSRRKTREDVKTR